MCCGQKRSALRSAPAPAIERPTTSTVQQRAPSIPRPPTILQQAPVPTRIPQSSVSLRYSESSPIRVRGPVTGRQYDFSGSHPVQAVDSRDATALVRTRFFRQG